MVISFSEEFKARFAKLWGIMPRLMWCQKPNVYLSVKESIT